MKSISEIMDRLPPEVQDFLREYGNNHEARVAPVLNRVLGVRLAAHCKFASYQKGRLKLTADSAPYCSQIHYHLPALALELKQSGVCADLEEVTCSVARHRLRGDGGGESELNSKGEATNATTVGYWLPNRLSGDSERLWRKVMRGLKDGLRKE